MNVPTPPHFFGRRNVVVLFMGLLFHESSKTVFEDLQQLEFYLVCQQCF